jgi:cytochrome P450
MSSTEAEQIDARGATPTISSDDDAALAQDPRVGFGRLREKSPVLRGTWVDGSTLWVLTRHTEVRAVLGDPRVVTTPPASSANLQGKALADIGVPENMIPYLTRTILDTSGVDHIRLRRLVSRAFTAKRVAGLRPRVEEITGRLLDGLAAAAGEVDLVERFAYPLSITMICELVGVPEADRPDWRRWSTALISSDVTVIPDAVREMVEHCHDLVSFRRNQPANDLLSGLIVARDDNGDALNETEVVTMLLALLFAGHETTANLIANSALALLQHPEQRELLRADPALWPGAVQELMRWASPILVTRVRYATEDVPVAGIVVQPGEAIQTMLMSANHDPRVFDDPDRLDVTRRPGRGNESHVGFGHGTHFCLGASLAREEAEVALHSLFDRFPDIRATGEPQWLLRQGERRQTALPVLLHGTD